MKNKILLLFTLVSLSVGSIAQTVVPSIISSNQVWDLSGSPYQINQNTYIDSGVSVLVLPGVEVVGSATYKLRVAGEFRAIGKWDSLIEITSVYLEYMAGSVGYDPVTGNGSALAYCKIKNINSGSYLVETWSTSLKVSNSFFLNTNSGIRSYSNFQDADTSVLWVEENEFYGTATNSGTLLHSMSTKGRLVATDNLFANASIIYSQGDNTIKNNTFKNINSVSFYVQGKNEVSCNKFSKMQTVNVYLFYNGHLDFSNNTLDSIGTSFINPMLGISRSSTANVTTSFRNNNFLTLTGATNKVRVSGNNPTPTSTDTLDFESNFWGTSDSATIEGYISDYNDNSNILGRVNFANFDSIPVFGCSYNNPCAIADFSFTKDYLTANFKNESIGNNEYTIKWSFGDGDIDTTNQDEIEHYYSTAGIYKVCLYVYNESGELCDSICKNVEIFSKCESSYYFALDTTVSNFVYVVNTSTGINHKTKYYWTFGDGTGSSETNPTHTYTNPGKYQLCLTIFDTTAGCFSTFCDSVDIDISNMSLMVLNEDDLTNVKNQSLSSNLNVYPNPSSGKVFISVSANNLENFNIEVRSIDGKIVQQIDHNTQNNNVIELDLSTLQNGLYLIRVQSGEYTKTIKVLLSK